MTAINSAAGIYLIRNVAADRFYIGDASSFSARWATHRRMLARGIHHSRAMQADYDRHGAASFAFEVVALVEDGPTRRAVETIAISSALGADCYNSAKSPPSSLGKKIPPRTAAHCAAISAANTGRKHSAESGQRKSLALKGRGHSPEWVAKIAASLLGKPVSQEQREAVRRAQAGSKHTPEHRSKISASLRLAWARRREIV